MDNIDTINVEPTDEELVEAFDEYAASMSNSEIHKAEGVRAVKRLWQEGHISKKSAFVYINFGVITDELEEVMEEMDNGS